MLERTRGDGDGSSTATLRAASAWRRALRIGAVAAVLLAFAATAAFATSLALKLGSASNGTLGENVVVSAQGRTLYMLSPETSRHLLCKTSECFKFWPPLTVSSIKTKLRPGPGVEGHLGILRRSNGTLQVTLRGAPLYRYSKDHAKGEANGQGIESFGGTWHAATAAAGETVKPAMPSTPAMPSYPSSTPPTTPASAPNAPEMPSTTTGTTTTPSSPPPYQYPAY